MNRQKQIEEIIKKLNQEAKINLDEAVNNAASELASAKNNEGLRAQIEFLLDQSWSGADIIYQAEEN